MCSRRRLVRTGCVISVSLAALLTSSAYACCSNYAEFAAACYAMGGVPGYGATCKPKAGGSGGGTSGYSGGRASSNQQLMKGLAEILGAALADLFSTEEAQHEQARAEDMQRVAEQMARFQEEERLRIKKHQTLLSSLKGSIGGTELGFKGMETQTLELKAGAAYFGSPGTPGGRLTVGEEKAGLSLKMTEEPRIPVGKPVDVATMDQVWQNYYRAADTYAEVDVRRQQLEREKKMAEQIRREAEKQYKEQQAHAALIPKEQPNRKEEDDKLADAERLFRQATDLDDQATKDLDQAKRDTEKAKADMDRAENERTKAEKSLAQTEPAPAK
jgi:hypothetical protein